MKIDVSYDVLLQALVEAIRGERDHGAALMSLVSRLVDQACQQDWFETHRRTEARLRLAQMACGHMPKGSRSALPVLEVIAEAARWALKADEVDSESRAVLLAIWRPGEPIGPWYVDQYVMVAAAVITVLSGAEYVVRFRGAITSERAVREPRGPAA